uniref:Major facilitator superfamily (MFS) profile domain-containing protein n=1 Tax=Photinus pyralis TaxID=7054 RepID=A0A1Y1KTX4_PHOPY
MDDKVATAEKSFKLLLPQTLAAFFVTSLHLLVGQVIAFSGIIVPQLFEDANGTIPITESGGAWIASAPVFSGFAASIVGGMLSDSIGRLNTLMWAGLPGIVGSVLIAMAPNLSMIIWGRAIMGISWMFVSVATPVYISEISHPDIRGFLLTFLQVFLSLGSVLVYLKGWAMSWRIVSWITILYIAVPVVLIFFMPESPPWLVSKGRNDRARKSLEWLHSNHPNLKEKVISTSPLSRIRWLFSGREGFVRASSRTRGEAEAVVGEADAKGAPEDVPPSDVL